MIRQYVVLCETGDVLPTLERFFSKFPGASPRQRADVILIDQSMRWQDRDGIGVEEYCERFPDVAADGALKLELILAEYDYRAKIGEVDYQAFVQRFPEIQDVFRNLTDDRDTTHQFPHYSELIRRVFDEGSLLTTCWAATTIVRTTTEKIKQIGSSRSILGRCSPFEQLPTHVVRLIESHMYRQTFAAGEYLIRQGDKGDSLIVLVDGAVEISTDEDDGTRHFLTRSDQVQVLGEMSLLMEGERTANVIAEEDVDALILPVATFHELASQFPSIRVVLSLLLSERLGHADRDDVLTGRTLHGYRVGKRLGKGGMSVVYEALDLQRRRAVALKMMSHRLVYNDDAQQQFQREADIVQSLEHPRIVQVYDRFSAFHTCFMVMELCNGKTLYHLLKQDGAMPLGEAKKLLGQVGEALFHAHQAGIVHRDIKPGNIMVDDSGEAKLMDFGLAMSNSDGVGTLDALVGTPRYMAPEQISGGQATPSSDIFALGSVAYELVTNKPLFREKTVAKLLRVHSEWPGPSTISQDEIPDPDIHRFIQAALKKSPDDRDADLASVATWS